MKKIKAILRNVITRAGLDTAPGKVEWLLMAALLMWSLLAFDFVHALEFFAAFAVAYIVPRTLFVRCGAYSVWAHAVLITLWVLLVVLVIGDLSAYFSNGGTWGKPWMTSDADTIYKYALAAYDNPGMVFNYYRRVYVGLPLLMVGLWKVFGVNVIYPLALNIMASMLSMVLTSITCVRVLRRRVALTEERIALLAMVCMLMLGYLHSQEVLIHKESLCTLAMAMMCYSLLPIVTGEMRSKGERRLDAVVFVMAVGLQLFVRTPYTLIFIASPIALALFSPRRMRSLAVRYALFALVAYVTMRLAWPSYLSGHSLVFSKELAKDLNEIIMSTPTQKPYGNLVGNYYMYPWYVRVALLPLSCAVQFITPFPWGVGDNGFAAYVMRFSYGWYFVGGLALMYFFGVSRSKRWGLGGWPLMALICYCVPAYTMAGSVARYSLPFQPIMIPMAVMCLYLLLRNDWRRRLAIMAAVYVVLLLLALGVCYVKQTNYLLGC